MIAEINFATLKIKIPTGRDVNTLLYIGLGILSVGLFITFMGLGENGFKTFELQLLGPAILILGSSLVIFQILSCVFSEWRSCNDQANPEEEEVLDIG